METLTLQQKFEKAKNEYNEIKSLYQIQFELVRNENPWVQDEKLKDISIIYYQKECLFFDLKNKIAYRKDNARSRFDKV